MSTKTPEFPGYEEPLYRRFTGGFAHFDSSAWKPPSDATPAHYGAIVAEKEAKARWKRWCGDTFGFLASLGQLSLWISQFHEPINALFSLS